MAYRIGNRKQMDLFPQSLEDYVGKEDPVRAYDAFIEALDLKELGLGIDHNKVGNSSYDPKAMLKLLAYSYSYGWQSSRKIERAIAHNVSFMWIMGGLKPDHKTISEFRRANKPVLKKMLKQCARMCLQLELIEGNVLFADGTKIRANASRAKNYTKEQYIKKIASIEERIAKLLDDCEQADLQEQHNDSLIKMNRELTDTQKLKNKMQDIIKEFRDQDKDAKTINSTDPDCRIMKSPQGSHASYNIQNIVDDKNGLIVHADATDAPNDRKQLSTQLKNAQEVTSQKCQTACADAGYYDTNDLKELDKDQINVIVPNQEQASSKEVKPFTKQEFSYDEKNDLYKCPEGHYLRKSSYDKRKKQYIYRITSKKLCRHCQHYGKCTQDKKGRTISRLLNEETKEKLAKQYQAEEAQIIYQRRKTRVEHPFGHIKKNLGINSFLLRGIEGAKAEIALASTCFNLARMITLLGGVSNMILRLTALKI